MPLAIRALVRWYFVHMLVCTERLPLDTTVVVVQQW